MKVKERLLVIQECPRTNSRRLWRNAQKSNNRMLNMRSWGWLANPEDAKWKSPLTPPQRDRPWHFSSPSPPRWQVAVRNQSVQHHLQAYRWGSNGRKHRCFPVLDPCEVSMSSKAPGGPRARLH